MPFAVGWSITRQHHFVLTSDALIVAPGGIGTALETLMIWQWLEVHHLSSTPLILVGNVWLSLIDSAKSSMLLTDWPLANAVDMNIPQCVANGDEAIGLIRKHHAQWLGRSIPWPAKKPARKTKPKSP